MTSRRDFLSLAAAGSALAACAGTRAAAASAPPRPEQEGQSSTFDASTGPAAQASRYALPTRFGLGGVALGNEFEVVTDEDAQRTLAAAWTAGVRYFDTSPWYGLGLAERRFGQFLHDKKRDDYVLSTKVGKLLKASRRNKGKTYFPFSPSPNDVVFDYSADGVRRSIEDSLQRMGVGELDIVFVHDLSPDNTWLPTSWQEQFDVAMKGAFPVLSKLRAEGVIRAWGIGVNTPEPMLRVLRESDPNVCLLASQYSLVEHDNALHNLFPLARQRGVKFVIGSSLNAGFLTGAARYNYGAKSWDIPRAHLDKREKLRAVAAQFGVDLRTAALRFSAAPDVCAALLVGARNEDQILADASSMQATVPPAFWAELKRQQLVAADAPVPA